jgi:Lar family restriction alleviation protein
MREIMKTNDKKYTLKPCLYCGGTDVSIVKVNYVPTKVGIPDEFCGRCKCGVSSPSKQSEEEAAEWWNKST